MKTLILSLLLALTFAGICQEMRPAWFPIAGSNQDIDQYSKGTWETSDRIHSFGCIGRQKRNQEDKHVYNPNWYWFQFKEDGTGFEGTIENKELDMDIVVFKNTFDSLQQAIQNCENKNGYNAGVYAEMREGNISSEDFYEISLGCSYSQKSKESFKIDNFKKNDIYILIVSTYNGVKGNGRINVKFTGNKEFTRNIYTDLVCDEECDDCYKNIYNCKKCMNGRQVEGELVDSMTIIPSYKCTQCENGFYFDKQSQDCLKCSLLCKTCKAFDDCITCVTKNQYIPRCQCQEGYFFNIKRQQCQKCKQDCKHCFLNAKGYQECSECIDTLQIEPPKCKCPKTYFKNKQTKKCEKCGDLGICKKSKKNYISCYKQYNRKFTKNSCVCKAGFFEEKYQNGQSKPTCQKCSGMCKTCNKKGKCLVCKSLKTRIPGDECKCKEGYVYNTDSKDCKKSNCHYSCDTCFKDNDSSACFSCDEERMLQNYNCLCKYGYYENQNKECKECKSQCATCESLEKCLTCKEGFIIEENSCICPGGYFMSPEYKCVKCKLGCKSCTTLEDCQDCDSENRDVTQSCKIKDGFYQDGCDVKPCSPGCKKCTDYENCLVCNSSDLRQLNDNKCPCLVGHYEVKGSSSCKKCGNKIKNCDCNCEDGCDESILCEENRVPSLSPNGCYKCICTSGYTLSLSGECVQCDSKCIECELSKPEICTGDCANENRDMNQNCECLKGYYEVNGRCVACPSSCLECTSGAVCKECDPKKNFVLKNGKCNCKTGHYLAENEEECPPCEDNCLQCNRSECEICGGNRVLNKDGVCVCNKDNRFYEDEEGNCQKCENEKCEHCNSQGQCDPCKDANATAPQCTCNKGFYELGITCQPCSASCKACTQEEECIDCFPPLILIETECFCPGATYKVKENICVNCVKECNKCDQGGCIECEKANKTIESDCTECETGYYKDGEENCVKCEDYCESCSNQPGNCTTCDGENRLKDEKCRCQEGYYDCGQENGDCCKCNISEPSFCKSCSQEQICTKCTPPRLLNKETNQCDCPDGMYDQDGKCELCAYFCQKCSAGPDTNCSPCKGENRDLNINCGCLEGYYEVEQKCIPCPGQNCTACDSQGQCTKCQNELMIKIEKSCECQRGYYLSNKECLECGACCAECVSGGICKECVNENQEVTLNQCKPKAGYYETNSNDQCGVSKCSPNCLTCSDYSTCITCVVPLQFNKKTEKCECPFKQFLVNENKCEFCPKKCPNCLNKETCIGCVDQDSRLKEKNCGCKDSTFESKIFSEVCPPCGYRCATCSEKANNCLTCNNKCNRSGAPQCKCKAGYVEQDKVCIKCDKQCKTCTHSPENCDECTDSKAVLEIKEKCLICEDGFYMSNFECIKCPYTCETCRDDETCITCIGEFRNSSESLCPCDKEYYEENKECKECSKQCDRCIDQNTCIDCKGNRLKETNCKKCPKGWYIIEGEIFCQKCGQNCEECEDITGKCIGCTQLNYLDEQSGNCDPCHVTCKKCKGPKQNDCLGPDCRRTDMIFDEKEGDCDCTNQQKWDDIQVKCVGCGDCCHNCYNDKCQAAKPYHFVDRTFGTCHACRPNCEKCTNGTECLTCKNPDLMTAAPDCFSCMQLYFDCNFKGDSIKVCKNSDDGESQYDLRVKSIKGDFNDGPANLYLNFNNHQRNDTAKLTLGKDIKCLQDHLKSDSLLQKYQNTQFYFNSRSQDELQKLENQGRLKSLIQMYNSTHPQFKGEERLQKLELLQVIELD